MRVYLLIMMVAAAVTFVLVPVAKRLALALGAITQVRARDVHTIPIPRLGGVAMYAGFVVAFLVASQIPYLAKVFAFGSAAWGVLVGAGLMCLVGAVDDVWELDWYAKLAGEILAEKEDGSLVRMKAVPRGITGYVVGKTFYQCVANMLCFLVSLAVGALALGGLVPSEPLRWLAAFGWCALGLVCSIPIGAVIGCLISSSVALVIPIVFLYGLMIISGIFSPVVGMAGWVQAIAKAFPVYWLGLGMRSAFLPGQAVALEAGESWHTLESLAVLGAWAAAGLVLAPILMRKMIRGVSGSSVAAARERFLARGY